MKMSWIDIMSWENSDNYWHVRTMVTIKLIRKKKTSVEKNTYLQFFWYFTWAPLLWSDGESVHSNEIPRRQKVPIYTRKRGRWKGGIVYWKKFTCIKTKNTEGLSACTDQLRQTEINYILFKNLPLQPWSILKSTLEDFSNWLSNYLGWQAKCFETEFALNW